MATALELIVVTRYKKSINPINNPNPAFSQTRDNSIWVKRMREEGHA